MNVAAYSAWLVPLLGILSTTQTHMAKALERQGIETLDLVRDRLRRNGGGRTAAAPSRAGRKPAIYLLGLILNHTTFIYHLFVVPLGGNTAQYTSMYGMGLLALLLYSAQVMKEPIGRRELVGALAILAGTLIVGVEGIGRPTMGMGTMNLGATVGATLLVLGAGALCIALGLKIGRPDPIGLAFGLGAGACGSLDPFLKSVGQAAGGGGAFAPGSAAGWVVLASSFLVGVGAFLITQWGFYRRARANLLVPAYNCTYVAVPVLLQVFWLPGYDFYWTTGVGLGLIMVGFVLMRGFGRASERFANRTPGEGDGKADQRTIQ